MVNYKKLKMRFKRITKNRVSGDEIYLYRHKQAISDGR